MAFQRLFGMNHLYIRRLQDEHKLLNLMKKVEEYIPKKDVILKKSLELREQDDKPKANAVQGYSAVSIEDHATIAEMFMRHLYFKHDQLHAQMRE